MVNINMIGLKTWFLLMFLLFSPFLWAQSENLRFETDKWDFGKVAEDGGKVEHLFNYTNNLSMPVVILEIRSGCGCTTPEYSRKPIKPGEQGSVKIIFDPMNRPGHFSKSVMVTTSASKQPLRLTVQGEVTPRQKSVEEQYPFDIGDGLRLSANFHAFAYVGRGEMIEERIGWINTSEIDLNVRFLPRQSSGFCRVEGAGQMAAGDSGEITLIYNIPENSTRYGTLNDIYDIEVNGWVMRTMLSAQAIAVDKYVSDSDDISVPVVQLSKNFIKFAEVKRSTTVVNQDLEIANEGETDLIIRAVEWSNKALECSLQAGDRIRPDEKKRIRLVLDTSDCDYGVWVDRLRVITNDQKHPMRTVRVTAIVVE